MNYMHMTCPPKYTAEHIDAREALLDAAIASGKFPRFRYQHYAAAYDADPVGTTELIGRLAPASGITEVSKMDKRPSASYSRGWLTQGEQRRINAAYAGEVGPGVVND